ncbi:hypothetical protein HK107_03030 [Parvularcula sp. ZS-1/3]|uniref:histidine kinase n=1 Tax=Parvularcula mediterranea TaxID=2732508 RepID=A0A7Y3RJN8_9PROT|nr:histidine kinase dimerization/phospho-acceptor domain-containing protein [Parvularcula mediterranea]NNU15298.1 hypothetical protein [Parvularcula mediterranea]
MKRDPDTVGATSLRDYAQAFRAARRLREAEEDAAAAQIDAEQSGAAKAAFLSGLNHELRTPLNHITGFAGLLRENADVPREKREEYLDNILHSAGLLLKHIDSILEAASSAGAKGRPRPEGADPLPILKRVISEQSAKLFIGKVHIAEGLPISTVSSRDLYTALGRIFAAFVLEGGERRAIGLAVEPSEHDASLLTIRFRLLSGPGALPIRVLRSLKSDLIRHGLRFEEVRAGGFTDLVLSLPTEQMERAA